MTRSFRLGIRVAVLLAAVTANPAISSLAGGSDEAWYGPGRYGDESSAIYSGAVLSSQYLTMRDGTKIAVDVLLPKGLAPDAKIPAIIDQTRYWRSYKVGWPFRPLFGGRDREDEKVRFVTHGYAWLDVDVRGTGASCGSSSTPAFSPEEVRDGAEIVDWIVRQPWSNGKVGATGISYGGTTSELLLANNHPAVKAVAVRFSQFDVYADLAFPGGVYFSSFIDSWAAFTKSLDEDLIPALMPFWLRIGAKLARAGVRPVDDDQDGSALSNAIVGHAANYDAYAEMPGLAYRDDVAPSALRLDAISPHTYAKQTEASGAAVYSYGGWFDSGYGHATIKRYLTLRTPGSKLTLGPWAHGGYHRLRPFGASSEPDFDQTGELLRFFDHQLKGIENGIATEKPVHYFTMVEEKWKSADTWPPPNARPVSYYFAEGNALSTETHDAEGRDVYRADYSVGTGQHTRWDGLLVSESARYSDRSAIDKKLLVYTSAPLAEDTEVTGHPIVRLFVASTASDGQFFVYLEDMDEQGRVFAVTEGEFRAIHRKISSEAPPYRDVVPYHNFKRADAMPLVPGEVAELVFDLLPTSYLFRSGHSIRIALAGADKDHFATPPGDAPVLQLFRGGRHASHIDLPILLSERRPAARH